MKKITLSLVFLLTMIMGGYGQVTVGEGNNTAQVAPFNAYYAYTYSQSIYLATEINASGSITSIQWYYNSTGAMANSQGLTIYLGQTTKTSFDSNLDFVSVQDLTAVYTGGIVTGGTSGWKTITLTTPFPYDGISNLIIAVDENMSGYDSSTDKFRNSEVGLNRTIYAYSDQVNTDPAEPTYDGNPSNFETVYRGNVAFVPNIIFGGITQSCVNPSQITALNATTTQVQIGWTGATGQTDWEVYVVEQGGSAPTSATVGTAVTGTSAYLKTGLLQNVGYSVYVRAKCSETLYSGWSGPRNFRTLCDPFGDFNEDFNTATVGTGLIPNCWTKTITSTSASANISVISNTAASAPNAIYFTNSDDATAQMYLVTPALTAIGANTHRIKFKARGGTAGQILSVGTMSDPANLATYTELQSLTLPTTYTDYSVTLNTSTTAGHIAFKHGLGGTYRSIYMDDLIWEPIPTTPPGCIEDMNTVVNEGCGNFATVMTWAAVPGADGYTVSIGTSANGQNLVVNNQDINSALTYSFQGNPGTTYYYTVRPYNANGPAVNCFEDMFTTYDDGCFCVALPTSTDGAGISNVQINNDSTPVVGVQYYEDFTENGAIDITQGVNTIMNVTLATAYNYWTYVWVDYNDNYTFEPSELVFSSTSETGATNPTVVNTSFMTPLDANLGEHRLRILSVDVQQVVPNPCYTGTWGIALDFLINVLPAPPCLPPTASTVTNITANGATLNWVSSETLFNIEYDFAGFNQGSGTVISGITSNTTLLSGLDAQADYAYYVQTDCGSGVLSPWTGPFTFRTACESFGEFTEDFTTETNYVTPECWYSLKNSTSSFAAINVYNYNDNVQFYNSEDTNASLYLITPALTDLPLATHRVKFNAYGPAGSSMVVGTMSDPNNPATFTPKETILLTSSFAPYSVSFLTTTTDSHVAFKTGFTNTYQYIYLDDVVWEEAPSCPDIYVVNFIGATPFTADISWNAGGNETAWQYAYDLATVEDPSGLTPVDVATTPATTIPALAPSTTYKVWVRASCGTEFGMWSPAKIFTTACLPVTEFPWTEGFEDVTTLGSAIFPNCWSEENGDWVTSNATTYNTARNGSNYIRNSWNAINEYMWTPGFELTAGVSYDFSFYMQGDGFTGWNVDVFQNSVQNSTGATQLGTTTTASGTGSYVIQPYALVSNTFVPTTSGTYYFAVRVNQPSGSPWYVAFDDFRLEPTPTCIAPNAPTATNATVTTATLNWTATTPAPANGYDYYVTSATAVPNATTVPTGTVGAGITTANLIDLTGSTIYKIYVRSICGTDDKSSWSDAGTFTTLCIPAVLPYTIDFENATTPSLPLCTSIENVGLGNNWITTNNPGYGFTSKVLYYVYTSAGAANAWFYTNRVNLVAGTTYSVSYDYGTNSTETWFEKLKVAYGTSASASAMTTEIADHPMIQEGELQENTATFTPTVSGEYVIGFNVYSDSNQYYLYVDNIVIQEALGTKDFDNNSFTAYPNPVKDVLNVSFTQNISNVIVYNLLGQQVLVKDVNANKGQVDLSSLATGTYLVKVNSENGVKTIKVIKE